jgi:acetyltransferase-like isoleucine patch superfamily enzyme
VSGRVIVSPNVRIRIPDHFEVGEGTIVDDFCYFSTRVKLGRYCHVASGCSIAGGAARQFELGDFSSLSSGVKVWCVSDDFVHDLVTIVPDELGNIKENSIVGDVTMGRFTGVGANAVIMPRNAIPEGSVIGALSFVPPEFAFSEWTVYAGVPIRPIRSRDRDAVLRQYEMFERRLAQT